MDKMIKGNVQEREIYKKFKRVITLLTVIATVGLIGCTKGVESNEDQKDVGVSSYVETKETSALNKEINPTETISQYVNEQVSTFDGVFNIGGISLIVPFNYNILVSNSWDFDTNDYKKGNEGTLNTQTQHSVPLKSLKSDSYFHVTLEHFNRVLKNVEELRECKVWGVRVQNTYAKKPMTFYIGNLKNGCTLDSIVAVYGTPERTYRDVVNKSWTYYYTSGYKKISFSVNDSLGLDVFEFTDSSYKYVK